MVSGVSAGSRSGLNFSVVAVDLLSCLSVRQSVMLASVSERGWLGTGRGMRLGDTVHFNRQAQDSASAAGSMLGSRGLRAIAGSA